MKQKMKLKTILSNEAFWTINKSLAHEIGLDATVLLQHFVDLQYNYFENGGFYQQQSRLLSDLPLSIDYLRKATKVLIEKQFLEVKKRGVPAKNHYTVLEDNILMFLLDTSSGASEAPLEIPKKDDKHKETNTQKNNNTNIDVPSVDDIKGKIFFKIVELYPTNRIGNRQHGLKKFNKLDIEQTKLAAKNLKRYLKAAGTYVKSLQNYIEEGCWTEEWLKAEETKQNKRTINTKHNIPNNYDNID